MSQAKATSDTTTDDADPVTFETMSELERGDLLIIEGEEYPVFRLNDGLRALFQPEHPEVVADGELRSIAYGARSKAQTGDKDDNPTALAFVSAIPEEYDDSEPLPEEYLLAENLDNVYVDRGGAPDDLGLPHHDDRESCPVCESDTARYLKGNRDGHHVEEVRKCTGDDCDAVWCYSREIDADTTAEVTTYDPRNDEYDSTELSGVFREVVSSRFKLDLRSNAKEGWFTAEEVAEFLNPKMNEDKDGERFGYVSERALPGGGVTWKDAQYDWNMRVEFRQIHELSA